MALIYYLYSHYGLTVHPGKKHHCPVCNHGKKTLSIKRDCSLARCFKCGHYFVQTKNGIYDSTEHRPAA